MRIGCFHLHDPVPNLHEPYAFASLHPWIDVNGVGSLVIDELETRLDASELAVLSRSGRFYDYTRYRPTIRIEDGIRDLSLPTTHLHYATREGRNDIILLRLLEPQAMSELYVDSVVKLLTTLGTKRYVLLGSMYDMVPHTRPLLISGYGMGKEAREEMRKVHALPLVHHGPSSIVNLVTKRLADAGIDALALVVSLPQYVAVEQDHMGKLRLLEMLNMLYDIPLDTEDFDRALHQRKLIAEKIGDSPEIKALLPQLEKAHELRLQTAEAEGAPRTTSEVDDMLWSAAEKDIGKA
jgi:predicted ATP-grasp superfamily ATP-dependent carboligase